MDIPTLVYDILKEAGGILLALSPLLSSHVRYFVAKKIQLSFDKALEDKKSINERKNYISKVRFDREFELYQKISEKQMQVYFDCAAAVVIARVGVEDEAQQDNFFEKFSMDLGAANTCLQGYAPFISKEVYEKYECADKIAREILMLLKCLIQFRDTCTGFIIGDKEYTNNSAIEEIEKLNEEIVSLSKETSEYLRNYLDTLDLIER